jgi:hypothetical protein
MKLKYALSFFVIYLINSLSPALVFGIHTNGLIYNDAREWVGERLRLTLIVLVSFLFFLLLVWGIYKMITRKRNKKEVPVQITTKPVRKKKVSESSIPEVVAKTSIPVVVAETSSPEENQLGRSIVKAAWILGISAVICVIFLLASHQFTSNRYLPLDKLTYIDTWTGKCYYSNGSIIE